MRCQRSTELYVWYPVNGGIRSEWSQLLIRGAMTWTYRGLVSVVLSLVIGPYLGLITSVSTKFFMVYGGLSFLAMLALE